MDFFALIAFLTAVFVLFLDRALMKDKVAPKLRWTILCVIPVLCLGLYLMLGNLLFV